MEEHYICTGGCEGVSPNPGVCGAKDCPRHGEPLEPCNCKDGQHDQNQESTNGND